MRIICKFMTSSPRQNFYMEMRRWSECDRVVRKSTRKCTPSTWHADRRSTGRKSRRSSHQTADPLKPDNANEIELPNVFRRKISTRECFLFRTPPDGSQYSGSRVPPAPLPPSLSHSNTDQALSSPVRHPTNGSGRHAARRVSATSTEDWKPTKGDVPTRHPIATRRFPRARSGGSFPVILPARRRRPSTPPPGRATPTTGRARRAQSRPSSPVGAHVGAGLLRRPPRSHHPP